MESEKVIVDGFPVLFKRNGNKSFFGDRVNAIGKSDFNGNGSGSPRRNVDGDRAVTGNCPGGSDDFNTT